MARLAGKVAIVTGGTRGIGAAISKLLHQSGYKVAANYAGNTERAKALQIECDFALGRVAQGRQGLADWVEALRAELAAASGFTTALRRDLAGRPRALILM